jgi:hypothetical protein
MYKEEIVKAFEKALAASHNYNLYDIEYKKAEEKEHRAYNKFRKECEKEGLKHYKVYSSLFEQRGGLVINFGKKIQYGKTEEKI